MVPAAASYNLDKFYRIFAPYRWAVPKQPEIVYLCVSQFHIFAFKAAIEGCELSAAIWFFAAKAEMGRWQNHMTSVESQLKATY